jgi:hypothetical protein
MYYPYFRGKQNELILLRDNAQLISSSSVIPILEPVKLNFKPLVRCFNTLIENNAKFVFIVNPICGELVESQESLLEFIHEQDFLSYDNLILGYIVDESSDLKDLQEFSKKYADSNIAIIHFGYLNSMELSSVTKNVNNIITHVFMEDHSKLRYRSRFNEENCNKVLIRDSFIKRSNKEHPASELFSELHITYPEENCDGFGDFLIAGEEFSESGGPAYAVAIHLTFIDEDAESDMYIKHYVSDRNSTPTDPGGKFLEALEKLYFDVNSNGKIYNSNAVQEFKQLYIRKHFPGLGVVKKLSMQHHVELIAHYLGKAD